MAQYSAYPQCKNSIINKSGSIEDRAAKFASSMRFSVVMDRMV